MPTRCDGAPNPRFWSPYSLGLVVISPYSGLGCNISLGNCRHSLLLLASGECEFHTWRQIFLFSANLFTASHAKQSAQSKSTNNPTKAPGPDPHAPPHGVTPSAPHDSSKNRPHWHDRFGTLMSALSAELMLLNYADIGLFLELSEGTEKTTPSARAPESRPETSAGPLADPNPANPLA